MPTQLYPSSPWTRRPYDPCPPPLPLLPCAKLPLVGPTDSFSQPPRLSPTRSCHMFPFIRRFHLVLFISIYDQFFFAMYFKLIFNFDSHKMWTYVAPMLPLLPGTCCCLADTGTTNEHPFFSLSLECHFTGNELSALAPGVPYFGSLLCFSFSNVLRKEGKGCFFHIYLFG